jgi:hypothetical protein
MAAASPQSDGPEPKRRKVRKGTQNCWECRRRKVRCIFAASTDALCENCRRRGTICISQEYPDEHTPSAVSNQAERLGRVEELVEHLVNSAVTTHIPNSSGGEATPSFSGSGRNMAVRVSCHQVRTVVLSNTAKARSEHGQT